MITDFFGLGTGAVCRSAAERRLELRHAREERERDEAGRWLAMLPDEMVVDIAGHLAVSGHLHALQLLLRGCTYWRRRLTECAALWQHLLWLHASRGAPVKGVSVRREGSALWVTGAAHFQFFTLGEGDAGKRVRSRDPRRELAKRMFTQFRSTRTGVVKREYRRMLKADHRLAQLRRDADAARETVSDLQSRRSSYLAATGNPSKRKIPPWMW